MNTETKIALRDIFLSMTGDDHEEQEQYGNWSWHLADMLHEADLITEEQLNGAYANYE